MKIVSTEVCDGGEHIVLIMEDGSRVPVTKTELTTGPEVQSKISEVRNVYEYKSGFIDGTELVRQVQLEKLERDSK